MSKTKQKTIHIVNTDIFTKDVLLKLFKLTDSITKNPRKYKRALKDKTFTLFFYEASTRTRLSFESAILHLGGNVLTVENALADSSASKGESLEDCIRVVSQYCDAIILRHKDDSSSLVASLASDVPVINAGSGKAEHPTQAILDSYTIYKHFRKMENLKIAVAGDLLNGRTCKSLVKLMSQFKGNKFYFVSHERLSFPESFKKELKSRKIEFVEAQNLEDVVSEVDVLYMTRVQKERFADEKLFNKVKNACTLTEILADKMKEDAIIMHPLPRVDEIEVGVDKNKRAKYFEQARNGLYTRMALLVNFFSKIDK